MTFLGKKYSISVLASITGCLMFLGAPLLRGQMLTIYDGETAEYRFHFDGPPITVYGHGPVNFLTFFGSVSLATNSPFSLDVSLYDGSRLLGTRETATLGDTWTAFEDSSSLYNAFKVVDVDFSTIADGTIDGRLLFQAHFPDASSEFTIPTLSPDIFVATGRQDDPSGGYWSGPNAIMDSATVLPAQTPVPEPSSYAIVAATFLAMLSIRRGGWKSKLATVSRGRL